MATVEFTDKFVAFVDILGFKHLVAAAESGTGMSLGELLEVAKKLGSVADREAITVDGPTICPASRHIRRDLAAVTGRVVLMGDLNMADPKPSAITGYRSLARHDTFPVDNPNEQLDHILIRGSWAEVTGSRALRLPLSDHLALSFTLHLGG